MREVARSSAAFLFPIGDDPLRLAALSCDPLRRSFVRPASAQCTGIQKRPDVGAGTPVAYFKIAATVLIPAAVILVIGFSPRRAVSLPLYARQTGQPCATCHTAFLELTPFGRRFKLGGYTLGGGDWNGPPFAVMLQPTFTNTQAAQPGGAAPGLASAHSFREPMTASTTGLPGTIRTYALRSRSTSRATPCFGEQPLTTTRPSRMSGTPFPPGAFPASARGKLWRAVGPRRRGPRHAGPESPRQNDAD
jgi:hypothetical protein